MTEEDKLTLLQLLRAYHKEEKEKTQGLVELKVCEEAAEVLMQDLQSLPTEPEEMDLLMCLVQKHMQKAQLQRRCLLLRVKDCVSW